MSFSKRIILPICLAAISLVPATAEEAASASYLDDELFDKAVTVREPAGGRDRDLTYPIAYVFTRQVCGLVILNEMDREKTGFGSFGIDNFKEGFRRGPEWDNDEWYWNYLGHPLWGSETFLRARAQNFTFFESFLFSTASSVIWEFGMENWASHPSQQDLLITSTVGSLIGEVRYQILMELKGKNDTGSKLLRFGVDPLQSSTKFFGEKVLGLDWSEPAFRIDPTVNAAGDVGVSGSVSIKF
jgi:hypothetical protein